jgi:hypothetical protein
MNLEEVKQFLEQNKENQDVLGVVKQYAPKQEIGLEDVQKLVNEKEDFKRWIESEKDKHFSKGLDTWKQKSLPSVLDEEIKKRFPEKDPKDLENESLRTELENFKKEILLKDLKAKALTIASEKKIPNKIIDFFIGQDEESTVSNLNVFEEVMESYIKSQVDERLGSTHQPPSGGSIPTGQNPFKKETLNLTEQARLFKENPELAKQLQAQAK